MASFLRLWFSGGSLHAEGEGGAIDLLSFDPRTRTYGAPARYYAAILAQAAAGGVVVDDEIGPLLARQEGDWALDPPEAAALDLLHALDVAGGQGIFVIEDEAERRALGLLALGSVGTPALLVTPTRPAAEAWGTAVGRVFSGPRGSLGGVTVAQAGEAPELLRRLGHRFGLIVIDAIEEAPGELLEALEAAVAPLRVGLAASLPVDLAAAAGAIGPVVGEVRREGPARWMRLRLALGSDEREARARTLDAIADGAGEEAWQRLAWIEGGHREALAMARLLLGRHRDDRVAIEPGAALRAAGAGLPEIVAALVAGLPPESRGELLSLARSGRLTLAGAEERADAVTAGAEEQADAATAGAEERADAVTAGAEERADAATAGAEERADAVTADGATTGATGSEGEGGEVILALGPVVGGERQKWIQWIYEIGYIEGPCWGAGAWHAAADDRQK
jgi:hypothetical protein